MVKRPKLRVNHCKRLLDETRAAIEVKIAALSPEERLVARIIGDEIRRRTEVAIEKWLKNPQSHNSAFLKYGKD